MSKEILSRMGVAVNLNNMNDLDDLEREAGLDPDSADSRLRQLLAEEDDELLEQLVLLRKAKGLTQQVVADRMQRDKAAVSNFERLSADPHQSTIRRYAAAIGAVVRHSVQDADLVFNQASINIVNAAIANARISVSGLGIGNAGQASGRYFFYPSEVQGMSIVPSAGTRITTNEASTRARTDLVFSS